MEESLDERLTNLKNISNKYNSVDQQYIADKLSSAINSNFKNVDYQLSYSDLNSDVNLKYYLTDPVYKSILSIISDLKEYRALEKALYQSNNQTNAPSLVTPTPSITPSSSTQLNAQFNDLFAQQSAKNRVTRLIKEEQELAYLFNNDNKSEKNIKLFHTLTFAEIVDNLANSIVVLFTQIYTLDINGLAKSQDNYIYYGFTLIMMYIILTVTWQNIQS